MFLCSMRRGTGLNDAFVRIRSAILELDIAALMRVVQADATLAFGPHGIAICWMAVKILHRCVRFGANEVVNEQWFSIANWLTDVRLQFLLTGCHLCRHPTPS